MPFTRSRHQAWADVFPVMDGADDFWPVFPREDTTPALRIGRVTATLACATAMATFKSTGAPDRLA